jgi:hypothetical protein
MMGSRRLIVGADYASRQIAKSSRKVKLNVITPPNNLWEWAGSGRRSDDGGGSVNTYVESNAAIASRLAPTVFLRGPPLAQLWLKCRPNKLLALPDER